ncbi:N-acetylmuramoyl-L-alanine amidase [Planococcus sp. A6]|uniref:N-acetylmuramoyl-L-alanine amidase n=1 Tax=Planococcus sp. A6 TaxID=2992760 RepID=UPI00237BD4C0|nr:N-acetylmuramoyl-L-alanine amidase [Planococcus sp. A6]MDE0581567.1 N-acetylmuramoyl-L-alanine amidase [Planococcus sp. A6]
MPKIIFFAGHDHDTWEKTGGKGVRTNLEADGVYEEFDTNFIIAKGAVDLLRKEGFTVLFPQQDKRRMTLKQRVDYANAHGADLMIDVHSNASASRTATGAAAFYWYNSAAGRKAADIFAKHIKANGLPTWSGGTYASQAIGWSSFYMLKYSEMPAVLTESFFFTTRSDLEKYLLNPKVQKVLMKIHANIALEFFGKKALDTALDSVVLPDGREVVKIGSRGAEVKYAQIALGRHEFETDVDSIFGKDTDKKTKAFQEAKGLVVDGIIGAATWTELEKKPQAKPVVSKPAQKEEEDMEQTAVVINGTADAGAATLLAFQLGCGVFFRKDAEKRQVAKEIYIAGGGKGKIKGDNLIDLSGKTRSDTAKNVTAKLK